jgi:diguanylate cyclase (GGDEF)-like protein
MVRRPAHFASTSAGCLALAIFCALAVVILLGLRSASADSRQAAGSARTSGIYQESRFAVSQEESLERKYRLEPSPAVLAGFRAAGDRLVADLHRLPASESATVVPVLRDHTAYRAAVTRMFAAGAAGDPELAEQIDADVADPAFARLERTIFGHAAAAATRSLALGEAVHAKQARTLRGGMIAFALVFACFGALGLTLRRVRRRLEAARAGELERLAEMAVTDPLTGLRNHRAFHEDLARELQRLSRTAIPFSLVLLDLDELKALNDSAGHQAGDERLQALAEALRASARAGDCAYRIGGDEFAIILPDCRAWGALELVQRVGHALTGFTITSGITEALGLRPLEELVHEADMALIGAKRIHQESAIYTPEMRTVAEQPDASDEHHTRILATALARAVDAKDAYTRSHCQTVSQLCAVIGAELGMEEAGLARVRLAGLLHDVGKIGVPDAILNKPAALTAGEYVQMQRHSLLGFEIVDAAGLPEEARWVRHHHERIDGGGYPDRLTGDAIPLQSRIILVADAFEAMTADRPYRRAPGREFAVGELQRGAGTQFDAAVVDALLRALDRLPAGVEPALAAI